MILPMVDEEEKVVKEEIKVTNTLFHVLKDEPYTLVPWNPYKNPPLSKGFLYGAPALIRKYEKADSGLLLRFQAMAPLGDMEVTIIINGGEYGGSQTISINSKTKLKKSIADLDEMTKGKLTIDKLTTLEIQLKASGCDDKTVYRFDFLDITSRQSEHYLNFGEDKNITFKTLQLLPLGNPDDEWFFCDIDSSEYSDYPLWSMENLWDHSQELYSVVTMQLKDEFGKNRIIKDVADIYTMTQNPKLVDQNKTENFTIGNLEIDGEEKELNGKLDYESRYSKSGGGGDEITFDIWNLKIEDSTYYDYDKKVTKKGFDADQQSKTGYQVPYNFKGKMMVKIEANFSTVFTEQKIYVSLDFENALLDDNTGDVKLKIKEDNDPTIPDESEFDFSFHFSTEDFDKIIKEDNVNIDFFERLTND